jgi:hypothetical protein
MAPKPERIEKIKNLLDDIEGQLKQARYSYSLAIKGEYYSPQVDNLVSAVSRIGTDTRAILRTLGIDPLK